MRFHSCMSLIEEIPIAESFTSILTKVKFTPEIIIITIRLEILLKLIDEPYYIILTII